MSPDRATPPRLVMVLLVRDEADVVDANVGHHLAAGVDHVVATDNGSRDGTRERLAEWARTGRLTLMDEPSDAYRQDAWMTRMALTARDELDADWILPNDADEFWLPPGGDIRAVVAAAEADVLACGRRNMLTDVETLGQGNWASELTLRAHGPAPMPVLADRVNDPLPAPYFYFALPPKLLLRARGLRWIHRGAHDARYDSPPVRQDSAVVTYHYPIRSPAGFERTVRRIGAAVENDPALPPTTSWKYRRWYRMLQTDGSIDRALADALPTRARVHRDLTSGTLVRDTRFRDRLACAVPPPAS